MTAPDSVAPAKSAPLTRRLGADLDLLRGGLRIICLRALGTADAADEAVQETLARAVVAIDTGRFTDMDKLGAYVAGIARHVCAHIHRDRKATLSLSEEGVDARAAEPGLSVWVDPLDSLISAAEHERLRVAFLALSTADQQLLRLTFGEDRSPADVAQEMAEPAERVRKRKSRALERLRRAFLGNTGSHDPASGGTMKETPASATGSGTGED